MTRASFTPACAQRVDRGVGIGIEPVFLAPHLGEGIGDAVGQRFVVIAQPGQPTPRRQAPRAGNVEPPLGGDRLVGPQAARLVHHRHAHALDRRRIVRVERLGEDVPSRRRHASSGWA